MLKSVTVALILIVFISAKGIICQRDGPDLLDRRCMDCFCQAQTGCNITYGCQVITVELCGPYRLGYYYWIDGGRLGEMADDDAKEAFRTCSNTKLCAEKTIQNYMKMYYKDCNGNGIADCVDFYRIHIAGHLGCPEKLLEERKQWLKFIECYLNTAPNIEGAFFSIGGMLNRL